MRAPLFEVKCRASSKWKEPSLQLRICARLWEWVTSRPAWLVPPRHLRCRCHSFWADLHVFTARRLLGLLGSGLGTSPNPKHPEAALNSAVLFIAVEVTRRACKSAPWRRSQGTDSKAAPSMLPLLSGIPICERKLADSERLALPLRSPLGGFAVRRLVLGLEWLIGGQGLLGA